MRRQGEQHKSLYRSMGLLGGLSCLLFILLGVLGMKNVASDRESILQHALAQGYWIARSFEISHRMVTHNHAEMSRKILQDIQRHPAVRLVLILDAHKQVLMASEPQREGSRWAQDFVAPTASGVVVQRRRNAVDMVFPASFADVSVDAHAHPADPSVLHSARWVLLTLDMTEAYDHYRAMVTHKVLFVGIVLLFGTSVVFLAGVVQKYALAHASLEKLEHIKRQLARFVPGTVQRLIEDNPERPQLDKVEQEATVLFLDIEQYTVLSESMDPEALNSLVERYFSAFLDTILTCGGEINETAGDGLMAIFTADTPRLHAVNATRAALSIRAQAERLNKTKRPTEPAILVNVGLSTGPVLLGATKMTTASGQERLTYTASGMVTNLAARLCALATHGDIYLSETTAHLVRQHFALGEPTAEHLKNVSEEIRVYKLM